MFLPRLELQESRFCAVSLKRPLHMFALTRVSCKGTEMSDMMTMAWERNLQSLKSVNMIGLCNVLPR